MQADDDVAALMSHAAARMLLLPSRMCICMLIGFSCWCVTSPRLQHPPLETITAATDILLSTCALPLPLLLLPHMLLCGGFFMQHHPRETITGPGEPLYVPRGWWHMVLNLDEAAAANIIVLSCSTLFWRPSPLQLTYC